MKRKSLAAGIIALLIAGLGVSAATPAQAASARAEPSISAAESCPAGLKTLVPDRGQVAKEGVKALFTQQQLAQNPTLGDDAPPQMRDILAHNPAWLTTIKCGPKLDPSKPHGNGSAASQPRSLAATAAVTPPVQTASYDNWSGYRINNVDYPDHQFISSVGGGWNVPSPYPPNSGIYQESASEWVGIGSGDYTYDQLIQVGTVAYTGPGLGGIGPSGTYGFFEMYPYQNEQMISNYSVVGGDIASAYVTYLAKSNQMLWTLCTKSASYKCVSGSENLTNTITTMATQGEWIVERHGFNGHISSLIEFHPPIDFYGTYTEMRGGPSGLTDKYVLGQGPVGTPRDNVYLDRITMTNCNNGAPLVSTSGLNYPTTGEFEVVWKAKGDTC
jgi:hypothetical protein